MSGNPVTHPDGQSVLFDFSNIRNGGSLQAASATLQDLSDRSLQEAYGWLEQSETWISTHVLEHLNISVDALPGRIREVNTLPGMKSVLSLQCQSADNFLIKFTQFGPTYLPRLAKFQIAGFADGTLVHPPSAAYGTLHFRRPHQRLKRLVKKRALLNEDLLIVESEKMAALAHAWLQGAIQPVVIPNQPHPVFTTVHSPSSQLTQFSGAEKRKLLFLTPARLYPHKNLDYLIAVSDRLARLDVVVTFLVTLREQEWMQFLGNRHPHIENVGELTPAQLNQLYERVDGVFFPSLLETASATPLEALRKALPLFASDRDFIREQVGDSGWYFDPTLPESGASRILEAISRPDLVSEKIQTGLTRLAHSTVHQTRTNAYLDVIDLHIRRLSS